MTIETTPTARIRAGAIVWSVIAITISSATLYIVGSDERRAAVTDWVLALTPTAIWLLVAVATGGVLLLTGILAAIRRAQVGEAPGE